jgi:hypothetical protein
MENVVDEPTVRPAAPPTVAVVIAELIRELHESLQAADRSLRLGQFTAARQAVTMAAVPVASLAAVFAVDLDAA